MAANLEYICECNEDGEITIRNKRGFIQDVNTFFKGKLFKMKLFQYRKTRSLPQNGYYHACVIPAVLDGLVDNGYERHKLNSEVVHEFLKEQFLKTEIISEKTGDVITVTKSTSELTTVEFMDYIASIQKWASEFLGIVIEDPNTQSKINF